MKPIHEYETPESNKMGQWLDNCGWVVDISFSRNLEQRLAACRDDLACINSNQCMDQTAHNAIRETLAMTAPKQ